jgi:hypothetical protein
VDRSHPARADDADPDPPGHLLPPVAAAVVIARYGTRSAPPVTARALSSGDVGW